MRGVGRGKRGNKGDRQMGGETERGECERGRESSITIQTIFLFLFVLASATWAVAKERPDRI